MANASKEQAASQAPTKPVESFRLCGVSVSVFENVAKVGDRERTFHKVSLQKRYRDGDDWKSTASLGRDDLPIAELLLKKAWQYILEAEATRGKDDSEEE